MDLKRKGDAGGVNGANGGVSSGAGDLKRLAKFYAPDRPPRKRLRTLLEFIKSPSGSAGEAGNIAVAVQTLLSGAPKDANAAAADHATALSEFWSDPTNGATLFTVVNDCVTELETLYSPHEVAFRKPRKKPLEAEDWTEVFEGLEALVRHNTALLADGWNAVGFATLFTKLLKRDNHALIKKYAFRCLALYTDATRSLAQLHAFATGASSTSSNYAAIDTALDSDVPIDGDDARVSTANRRRVSTQSSFVQNLELLRESVDFSPYGGGSIQLPDVFTNEGVHVEGWMRSAPTQADEPVDMLKFIMDLSLERDAGLSIAHHHPRLPTGSTSRSTDRFAFWCELLMRFYMPLLYPKVCLKHKLKDVSDTNGFFHHCPGAFQRVVARWLYKLRGRDEFMDVLWATRAFADVVMETIRQRFAYRDVELVLDAIKFYSGLCSGAQYAPEGMRLQMNESSRAMISHVSQLFHPSVILEDTKMLLHSIELLELISQRRLDEYTATYLRKFVVSTIDNCVVLREPHNVLVLSAMLSVVLHVWMHAAITMHAIAAPIWMELTVAMRRWLVTPTDVSVVGAELLNCWQREVQFASCLLLRVLDASNQSAVKIMVDGATIVPVVALSPSPHSNQPPQKLLKDASVKLSYVHASATFLTASVTTTTDATLLLDRILHLLPPLTVAALPPSLHLRVFEGLLQLVELWIDAAICAPLRPLPTPLHAISPSTVIALLGEWFVPACELESVAYQNSRCLAIIMLCKLCGVRCVNPVTSTHVTILARVLFTGVTSPSGVVVSTVLQRASAIFTLNLDGLNVLVPSFLHAVDQIIIANIWERATVSKVKASDWNKELTAALDVVFSIATLPKRFPQQNFVRWPQKFGTLDSDNGVVHNIVRAVPDTQEDVYAIIGRVLVRIVDLPFTDIVEIQKRALWGLYCLVVSNLDDDATTASKTHVIAWIEHLIACCQTLEFSIAMTALSILQDLADFHAALYALDATLVGRIVMTLAVFAQQQVEEASMEVQAAIESGVDSGGAGDATHDKLSNAAAQSQQHNRTSGAAASAIGGSNNNGMRRGSDNRTSRFETPTSEPTDAFSKLKNKLKPAAAAVVGASATAVGALPPLTPVQSSPALQSPARPPVAPASATTATTTTNERELPALRLIVQKTSAIFDCLRFWVMHCGAVVLQESDVRKLLFSAIEAALVGTLPDGDWQREVERARSLERRLSMPLLFLGLQMRALLFSENNHAWLRSFDETAVAAEGLLLHLLHHLNGFPSPAGVDQMISNCAELSTDDDNDDDDGGAEDATDATTTRFSFVFMNAIVITVVGSLDSPCVRFIARDMTGLFTWEIAPAVVGRDVALATRSGEDASTRQRHPVAAAVDVETKQQQQRLSLHTSDAAVRIDTKPAPIDTNSCCRVCGGDKPRAKSTESASSLSSTSSTTAVSSVKLAVTQLAWAREQQILENTLCPVKSTYVFHDDAVAVSSDRSGAPAIAIATAAAAAGSGGADAAANGKKKSSSSNVTTRASDVEKMPGAGNRDERIERLEKIARLHEERNNVGASASLASPATQSSTSSSSTAAKKCECAASDKKQRRSSAHAALLPPNPNTTTVLGLFEMDARERNVGSLDTERCLLDLVLDSIPMVFRDGVGDTTDKTLLGGRYAMQRYNLMDATDATSPLVQDAADRPGFSFLQRLIHDEECYAQLKAFVAKIDDGDNSAGGKDLVEFCDAVKRYERSNVPTDRLGQASVIYWEFFTADSARSLAFPSHVARAIQHALQAAQRSVRQQRTAADGVNDNATDTAHVLSGALFQAAMAHVEVQFEASGLLDQFVAALDQAVPNSSSNSSPNNNHSSAAAAAATSSTASAPTAGASSPHPTTSSSSKDSVANNTAATASIPPQLALFDAFSIMELNARIAHAALTLRNNARDAATSAPAAAGHALLPVDSNHNAHRVAALDMCRLFLSQTGLLPSPNGDARTKSFLKLLDSSVTNANKLTRSLRHLDKSPVRETMKIGVLFVGKHQHTQSAILQNDRGSAAYDRFVAQLGWQVNLATHRGFAGGLDTNPTTLSNGATTVYYATAHSEVVFHVVTMMPTKASDAQQIDKKRHVGNDFVHIVWCDRHTAQEYDPQTITSHFNDVQVVLYPLTRSQTGLFNVQIFSKASVARFGPLQSGMVVHERDLASLVRQTAMNANRVCRAQTSLYVRPYATRKKLVDEIVERYAVEYNETQLLGMLFATSSNNSNSATPGGATSTTTTTTATSSVNGSDQ